MESPMKRLVLLPLLLSGCKSVYYVEYLVGSWAGTAEATGQSMPMTAAFEYEEDEDGEGTFAGTVDIDSYVYLVNGATSDAESADVHLVPQDPNRGEGDLTKVVLTEEEDAIEGSFEINVCPPGTGQDPAICVLSGTFSLDAK